MPACCFSEEVNEAALSRLGKACRRNPRAVSTEEVNDLYVLVKPGRRGYKQLRTGGVSAGWQSQLERHLDDFIQRQAGDVPFIPWVKTADKKCVVQGDWPYTGVFPESLQATDPADLVRDVFHFSVCKLVQGEELNARTTAAYTDTFDRRPPTVAEQHSAKAENITKWENTPPRFRGRRPVARRVPPPPAPPSAPSNPLDVDPEHQ